MKQSAREGAFLVVYAVEEEEAYANIALRKVLQKGDFSPLDRSFLTELSYGTIRRRNTLDWVLRQYVSRPLEKVSPKIRNILRLGVYQLLYMDKVPPSAAVNETVNLARRHGHPGTVKFVNGVLRNIARGLSRLSFPTLEENSVQHIALHYSHPEWMVQQWLERFGIEETISLCTANNKGAQNSVRVNTLKVSVDHLCQQLAREGARTRGSCYAPEGLILENFAALDELAAFRQGLIFPQDEAAMLVAHVVAPEAGSLIVDGCAAPGGKTTHLAQLTGGQGRILAYDIHQHKLELIRENCHRLGIDNVEVRLGDARELGKNLRGQVDFLLLDVPCSGTGVLRRHPDARWRKSIEQIQQLQRLQQEILAGAADCVAPGGVIVYSTCSINPEENQMVVESFLEKHKEYRREDIMPYLPFTPQRPEDRWNAQNGYMQMFPHIHGTDGFFMCRMRKQN